MASFPICSLQHGGSTGSQHLLLGVRRPFHLNNALFAQCSRSIGGIWGRVTSKNQRTSLKSWSFSLNYMGVKVGKQLLICKAVFKVSPFFLKKNQHDNCLFITPPKGCLISYTKRLSGVFVSIYLPRNKQIRESEMKQTVGSVASNTPDYLLYGAVIHFLNLFFLEAWGHVVSLYYFLNFCINCHKEFKINKLKSIYLLSTVRRGRP